MAAETGIPSVYLDHQLSHGRVAKRTQGSLIDRLRHKNSQNRSWTDSIKSVRSSVAERRMQADANETSSVQTCLDTIQRAMKVVSQQTLKERLDLIGRQLGLSTLIQDQKVSLSSDAFHVDVLLDGNTISSVKLANQGDIVDCPDLKDILKRGDFTEFIEHLQGLQSIYQVTSDEKLKSKAYLALQALEKDLNQLSQFQSSISGVANYIHKCPLGIMLPRLAGKPMKLIYFVSPYDLLDKKSLTAHPLTVEAITENFLGQSVTVCIEPVPESAAPNKLQTMPLMIVSKTQDGKSLPSFSAVSKINSMMLPANFVLVLPQSIPISTQLLQKITLLTSLEIHNNAECRSLRTLILESFSEGKIKDSQKLYVSLPDQQHIYFLDGLNGGSQDQQGIMISRIPFTHPTHVPQILNLLRQQLLFNMVIASCIRPAARKDSSNTIVFEVTAVSLQQLTIVFEHPAYDSMITVDVDMTDITNLKCHVTCTNPDQTLCSDEALSRVFQRCMSIPVMLRWLIGKGRGQLDKLKEAAMAAERERIEKALFLKEMQQRQAKLQATTLPTKGRPPPQPPHPPPLPPPPSYSHHYPTMNHTHNSSNGQSSMIPLMLEARNVMAGLEEFRNMTEINKRAGNSMLMSPESEKAHNPLLSTLLDEEKMGMGGAQTEVHDSPMLSRLLDDNTSVATTVIPMTCKPLPTPSGKRPRKRRSQSDMSGPSPKHRFGEGDSSDRLGSIGSPMSLDMGPGLINHGLSSAPTMLASIPPGHGPSSHHLLHHPMLNHTVNARSQGNVIDLTEDTMAGESSLKKLVDSVDKHFPHKDVKTEQDLSMLLNETEAPSRIPNILQNSPSGSKNENASTSLEVFLKGSGEVGRAKDFDPSDVASVHNINNLPKLSSLLLASSDSPTLVLSAPPHKANSNFFSDTQLGSDRAVTINSLLQDVKPSSASLREGLLQQPSSLEHHNDKQNIGIFEKFDISRQQQQNVKIEVGNAEVKSHTAEGKVSLKLRVGPLKQQNIVKPVVKTSHSMDESDMVLSKSSNNIGTFDFKSDEDDDDPLMPYSDRYVYAPSPTNKQKRASDSALPQKSEKIKKKERSSGTTTKRKREKDESKRERKRKKTEQEPVYRTVENDSKADFKLKIRVAKKPISDKTDILSDGKIHQSYEISKKSMSSPVEKLIPPKQETKEPISVSAEGVKGKDLNVTSNVNKTISTSGKTAHKPSPKSAVSKPAQVSDMSNKTDTKLVSKATIRLKPLTMPNSGSTVNISQSGSKTSSSNLANPNKTERRSSGSATPLVDKRSVALTSLLERRGSTSNVVDRRNSLQTSATSSSSSTTISNTSTTSNSTSTTTSTNLSLSSILPNAPTGSKIASLPRIPKLSSSSSNTSINRTSSLDPASGTSPAAPSGTKDNNSYNMGPAGRPISNTTSGQSSGGGRLSGSTTAAFNYSSNRQSFNINRLPGPAHRQSSPGVNSGQASQQRSSGLRAHHPSSGTTPTGGNGQKQSTSTHKTSNSLAKANPGVSNSAAPQKTFSGGSKLVNSGSNNSKMSHSNFSNVHKNLSGGTNTVGGQRQTSHGNNTRASSNSTNVNRSPNTSGQTKSPSSGKSPNITNAGRSPSLSSASKSPNITNVNRSPNISGYSAGKSPNINASRSPNVTNNTNRPSLNPSSSAKSHSSHKQSPGTTKSSNINKGAVVAVKTSSSTNSTTGSTKLSQSKSLSKTTSHISSSSHLVTTKSPSHSGTSTFSTGTTIISSVGDSMTSPVTQKPFQLNLATATYPEAVVTTTILKSTSDQAEVSLGAKSSCEITNCAMSEKIPRSTSSTPTTPMSADSNKTKFSFPSSRGRKNSLSAIVDKLKHNAVGSGIDLIGPLSASGDGSKHFASDNLKNQKTDFKFGFNSIDVSKQDENKIIPSSNSETMDKTFSSAIDGKVTHSLDRSSPLLSVDLLAGKTVNDYVKTMQSDTDMSGKVSYKPMKTLEDRSINVCKVTDSNHGLDLTVSKDKGLCNKGDSHLGNSVLLKNTNLENKHLSNKNKDKPCPLRIQPSPPSPTIQSPAPPSGKTSSPSISPFQPQSTPNSPMSLPSGNSAKLQKEADEQIFKIPSVKPSFEQTEEEMKAAESVGHLIDKNCKVDHSVQSNLSKDNQDAKACLEKSSSAKNVSSTKALSSPLSDISSPENGLVIDDDECLVGKSSTDKNILNSSSNMVKAPLYFPSTDKSSCNNSNTQLFIKEDSNNSINLLQADKLSSPMSNTEAATVSPKMGRSSARSPAVAKNPSGASTPKCSDSPCEIDDDLMDVALGFGN